MSVVEYGMGVQFKIEQMWTLWDSIYKCWNKPWKRQR